ncbi:MAG: branched-chain amino acid ABC transporter permease [Microbacterium sp.]|jgi:branched-subunit amino acid ABC-type transport system permease component|uniref:branched-chain amino acid ABC transporter permease n=1 Tax=Microbacterium sp. TaxID=51671 RepID=UPI002820F39D|nr:branched-chain amino acid ABC transporter permease [Microbacterium sp.]MDR2320214.1 branched-chain amino acid ABC transporter permease [Microbacterium sp.]
MIELVLSLFSQLGLVALLALSLSLVFGVSRIVNLAVGDLATIGAFTMVATAGLPFWVGILIGLAVSVPLLVLIERGLLSRLSGSPLASLLVTWGVGMVLRQVCELVWGATARAVPPPFDGIVTVFGVPYPSFRLVAGLVGAVAVAVVLVIAYRTRAGLRLRAVADNPTMAALLGTPPARTRTLTFVVTGFLAVLAGGLYSPLLGVHPSMGFTILIPAFVVLLLARPGSFSGTAVAALFVVALQVVLRRFFADTAADALFYVVVLVAVAVRSTPTTRRLLTWSTRFLPRGRAA